MSKRKEEVVSIYLSGIIAESSKGTNTTEYVEKRKKKVGVPRGIGEKGTRTG